MSSPRFDSTLNSPDQAAAPVRRVAVTKYGARFWAVWIDDELAVVAAYKKGAIRVAELLQGTRPLNDRLPVQPERVGRRGHVA